MNSTERRKAKVEHFPRRRLFAMRKCKACVRDNLSCVVSKDHGKCGACYTTNKRCDLSANWAEWGRFVSKEDKLSEQIAEASWKAAEAEAHLARLRRERKEVRRKLRVLGDTEDQNIAEIEEDERQQAEFDAVLNDPVTESVAASLDEFFAQTTEVTSGSSGASQ